MDLIPRTDTSALTRTSSVDAWLTGAVDDRDLRRHALERIRDHQQIVWQGAIPQTQWEELHTAALVLVASPRRIATAQELDCVLDLAEQAYVEGQILIGYRLADNAGISARKAQDLGRTGRAHGLLALCALERSFFALAKAAAEIALRIANEEGDERARVLGHLAIGTLLRQATFPVEALRHYDAVAGAEGIAELVSPELLATVYSDLAGVCATFNLAQAAARAADATLELTAGRLDRGSRRARALAHLHLARIALHAHAFDEADRELGLAIAQARPLGDAELDERIDLAVTAAQSLRQTQPLPHRMRLIEAAPRSADGDGLSEQFGRASERAEFYQYMGVHDLALSALENITVADNLSERMRSEVEKTLVDRSVEPRLLQMLAGGGIDARGQQSGLLTEWITSLRSQVNHTVNSLMENAIMSGCLRGYDARHVIRVGNLARSFALREGWDPQDAGELAVAARLRDVGMSAIAPEPLARCGPLTASERRAVRSHTTHGETLLANQQLAVLKQTCAPVARYHHEHWDGTGDEGLVGERIPVAARIVALCDAYEALTHDRPWRGASSASAALRTIEAESGKKFDPVLTPRFVAHVRKLFWEHDDLEAFLGATDEDEPWLQAVKALEALGESRRMNSTAAMDAR